MPATHILETDDGRYVTTRELIIDMLKQADFTVPKLAEVLDLKRNTVDSAVRKLHREGLCYICDYPPHYGTQGARAAKYRWGQGVDAVRPKWTTKAARASQKRYAARHKKRLQVKRSLRAGNTGLGIYFQILDQNANN